MLSHKDSNSRSTKIDENEKKRLENQFKALNTFYINDDGLVVYQTQPNSASQKDNTSSSDNKAKEENGQYLIKEESDDHNQKVSSSNNQPYKERTERQSSQRAPISSNIIKKEALKPSDTTDNREITNNKTKSSYKEKEETSSSNIRNSPIRLADDDQKEASSSSNLADKADIEANKAKQISKKSSVFNKNKRPSQYKTMEEAALAVEALLEDLRKEQAQTTSAGSMSSRLSGGAGRATLRKRPATNPSYSNTSSNEPTSNKNQMVVDDEVSEFGYEPSYFINGKEVDKVEVNRLRRQQIINKEVRTRNTVTGNPNGEIWYEVKYDN